MVLPIWMLKDLQIGVSQKGGLACIFLIATIGIIFDIIRIAIGDGGGALSLAALWNVLEPTIAVIVSTLPSYRALLVSPKSRSSSGRASGRSASKRKNLEQGDYELSKGSAATKSGVTTTSAISSARTNVSMDSGKEPTEPARLV